MPKVPARDITVPQPSGDLSASAACGQLEAALVAYAACPTLPAEQRADASQVAADAKLMFAAAHSPKLDAASQKDIAFACIKAHAAYQVALSACKPATPE